MVIVSVYMIDQLKAVSYIAASRSGISMSLKENLYESVTSEEYDIRANVAYNSFNLASSKTANKKRSSIRERFSRGTFVKLMILLLLGIALCGCLIFLLIEIFKLKSKVTSLEEKYLSYERNFTACCTEKVNLSLQTPSPCGGAGWRPVVNLNMADPSQVCPSPWIETLTPVRSCNKSTSAAGCDGVSFKVLGGTYSHVCGRAVGYTSGSPDAFADHSQTEVNGSDIDIPYVDGVSVTYGSPRQHIWSFAAGHGPENSRFYRCPCDTSNRTIAPLPPSFVGDNYFCDGEYNNALWDGEDCTTACCTFNSPPYFTTTLPAPTSDDIEVRICRDQDQNNEQIAVAELQLFVY